MPRTKKVAPETAIEVPEVAIKAPAVPKGRVVYIGPTLLRLGLSKGMVFIDGMPQIAKDLMNKHPLITTLFVKIQELNDALKKVDEKGSALWVAAQDLKGVNS